MKKRSTKEVLKNPLIIGGLISVTVILVLGLVTFTEQEVMDLLGYIITCVMCVVSAVVSCYLYYIGNKYENRNLFSLVPSMWTSAGVLGTFISLVLTLSRLTNNVNIISLVREISPAFLTSIIGIIGSAIYSIYNRRYIAIEALDESQRSHELLEEKAFEEYIVGMHQVLVKMNEDNNTNHKGLTELFNKYNTTLKEDIQAQNEILKRFIDDFVSKLDSTFETMNSQISDKVSGYGEERLKQTTRLLEGLSTKMHDEVKYVMTAQKDEVQNMVSTNKGAIESMSSTLNSVVTEMTRKTVEELSNNNQVLVSKYDELNQSQIQMNKEANEAIRSELTQTKDQLVGAITRECDLLSKAIQENIDSLGKSYEFVEERCNKIASNYKQGATAYQDVIELVHQDHGARAKKIEEINSSLQAIAASNKELKEVVPIIQQSQESSQKLIQNITGINEAICLLQSLESNIKMLGKYEVSTK